MGLGFNRVGLLLNKASEIVRREKRIGVALLAAKLGYRSPEYFRRSQLKLILEANECISYDPFTREVIWVCDDVEG